MFNDKKLQQIFVEMQSLNNKLGELGVSIKEQESSFKFTESILHDVDGHLSAARSIYGSFDVNLESLSSSLKEMAERVDILEKRVTLDKIVEQRLDKMEEMLSKMSAFQQGFNAATKS